MCKISLYPVLHPLYAQNTKTKNAPFEFLGRVDLLCFISIESAGGSALPVIFTICMSAFYSDLGCPHPQHGSKGCQAAQDGSVQN